LDWGKLEGLHGLGVASNMVRVCDIAAKAAKIETLASRIESYLT
jgi:hypothetical protein